MLLKVNYKRLTKQKSKLKATDFPTQSFQYIFSEAALNSTLTSLKKGCSRLLVANNNE